MWESMPLQTGFRVSMKKKKDSPQYSDFKIQVMFPCEWLRKSLKTGHSKRQALILIADLTLMSRRENLMVYMCFLNQFFLPEFVFSLELKSLYLALVDSIPWFQVVVQNFLGSMYFKVTAAK